jgi:hypothetical protein
MDFICLFSCDGPFSLTKTFPSAFYFETRGFDLTSM